MKKISGFFPDGILSVLAVLVSEGLGTQGFQQQAAGHLHRRDPGGHHDATDTCKVCVRYQGGALPQGLLLEKKPFVTIVIDNYRLIPVN